MSKKTTTRSFVDYTRELGDGLFKTGRGIYLAALGVVSVADEETRGLLDRLVERGERFERRDDTVIRTATERARRVGKTVEDTVQRTVAGTLRTAGIPSRDEIHDLALRVDKLTRRVDQVHTAH